MLFARIVAVALVASAGVSSGMAQTLRNSGPPAEFPPASYKGTQYVDSRGCAYIRAGIDGNVTWVPRVARNRKAVCNMRPTVVAGAGPIAPSNARTAPEIITLDEPETKPALSTSKKPPKRKTATQKVKAAKAVPAAKALPKKAAKPAAPLKATVVRSKLATQPKVKAKAKTQAKPAPAQVVAVAPKPKVKAPRVQARDSLRVSGCADASAVSQQYINPKTDRTPVRCGPQQEAPYRQSVRGDEAAPRAVVATRSAPALKPAPVPAVKPVAVAAAPVAPAPVTAPKRRAFLAKPAVRGDAVAETSLPRSTRVVPRHVAEARSHSNSFPVPKGYRPAWEDDRLNPKRAEGTLGGRDRMNLVWTATVPRRLIDRSTGRDVTAKVALVYPYLDADRQAAELGEVSIVSRNGQTMKRITRKAAAPKPTYSTRSAPKAVVAKPSKPAKVKAVKTARKAKSKAKAPTAVAGGRYVQVGLFGVPANATASAQKLAALGLPAKVGTLTRKGKTYRTVVAGPFTAKSASKALTAVKRAGFKDAYLR